MKQYKKTLILAACLIILALLLISCGGGGGSSAPNPPPPLPQAGLSKDNAGSVAGSVITSIGLITEPSYLGAASTEAQQTKTKSLPFLQALFNMTIAHIGTSHTQRMAQGTEDKTINCTGGGTRREVSQWTGSDNDPQNYTGTIIYVNCKEGTATWNGTVQITYQGSSRMPAKITTTLTTLTYTDTSANTNLTFTGVTIVYSDITYDANSMAASAAAAIYGTIQGTLNGKNINAGYDGFKMAYSFQGSSMNIQASGKINPVCLQKWVTTSTPATGILKIGSRCPVAGEINITDNISNVKMSFTSQGGMTVSFNNETSATYTNCSEAEGLCR